MSTGIKQPLRVQMYPTETGWRSVEADPPPPPIDDLSVNAGTTSAVLSWTSIGETVTVWRKNFTAGGSFQIIQTGVSGTATSYTDTGLTASTEYEWRLETASGFSNVVSATTSASSGLAVIFEDNFEGTLKSNWYGAVNVQQLDLPGETGRSGKGLRFRFKGTAPGGGSHTGEGGSDAWAEIRFDLGTGYPNLTIEFDMWIPSNYRHRADGQTNNKLLRLWQTQSGYQTDLEKVGMSLVRGSDDNRSTSTGDWKVQPTWGMSTGWTTTSPNFINSSDHGAWMAVKMEITAPTDSSNGNLKLYKNGTLWMNDNDVPNNQSGVQGYRHGYLLGYANSGFAEDTYIWIDNAKFSQGVA